MTSHEVPEVTPDVKFDKIESLPGGSGLNIDNVSPKQFTHEICYLFQSKIGIFDENL